VNERDTLRRLHRRAWIEAWFFVAQAPVVIFIFPPSWQIPYLQFVSIYAVVRTAVGEANIHKERLKKLNDEGRR
jgi:hypothetical protein